MNPLQKLEQLGQSIWYDNISRGLILNGELKAMVENGILGVTSNPTIFEKAISGSTHYDVQIRELAGSNPAMPVEEMIQALMTRDIQMAADVLLPVYERTGGRDGYVSVEVAPGKARDTQRTLEEVRQLWSLVKRKNVMVKIPATREGLPAVEQAISEGFNINVTLIFSVERYREVAEAYIAGLERRMRQGRPIDHVASVASVFVSRIDTLVDELLQRKVSAGAEGAGTARLGALQGKAAVANTKLVYQAFTEIFNGSRFEQLRAKGARVQRPLWGSTGTKNPAYSDLLYVETLVGPDTVNTVPPATLAALLDHLKPAVTIDSALDSARSILREIGTEGIDMKWVMKKLEDDGVAAFAKSFDGLYRNVREKRDHAARAGAPDS